jgi:hypothetical protein
MFNLIAIDCHITKKSTWILSVLIGLYICKTGRR